MSARRTRRLGLALATALLTLAACVDDDPPSIARVRVESSPAEPLLLVVSTNFGTRVPPGQERREAVLVTSDTVAVAGDYEEEFDMSLTRRVYVLLRNEGSGPEQVRVSVWLDGDLAYETATAVAEGEDLEYLYTWSEFR